jgi:VanZ family protein
MWLSMAAPVLICAVWSASIEMTQLFVPSRDCSALDLTTNIIGSMIGVLFAILLEDVFLRNRARTASRRQLEQRRRPDRAALTLLACWTLWLLFPLIPIMGTYMLRIKFGRFAHSPIMDPLPFLSIAVAWFAAGTLFRAGALRPARWLTAISVILIPAQFFIIDRQPTPAELAGAIVGAACFALFWRKRNPYGSTYWKILAWAFLATIVIRGLSPFRFQSAPVPFSLIPFAGFLNMAWQPGIQEMAQKSFWYGTAVWFMRSSGLASRTAIALVAAVLLLIEIAQTHIPGHTAEITDPLWAVFVGWALTIIAPPRPSLTIKPAH